MSDNPLKLTKPEKKILDIMSSHSFEKEWLGLELISISKEDLKRGSIYVFTGMLVDRGLIDYRNQTDEEKLYPTVLLRALFKINNNGLREQRTVDDAHLNYPSINPIMG